VPFITQSNVLIGAAVALDVFDGVGHFMRHVFVHELVMTETTEVAIP